MPKEKCSNTEPHVILRYLAQNYRYDYETGELIRKSTGIATKRTQLLIGKRKFSTHYLIWLMHYGIWPTKFVKHLDGDKANNRIDNLKEIVSKRKKKVVRLRFEDIEPVGSQIESKVIADSSTDGDDDHEDYELSPEELEQLYPPEQKPAASFDINFVFDTTECGFTELDAILMEPVLVSAMGMGTRSGPGAESDIEDLFPEW